MDEKEYIKDIVEKYAIQIEKYFSIIFDYYSIGRLNIKHTVGNIRTDKFGNHITYIKITPRKIFNRFKNDNGVKDKIEKNIKILFNQLFPTIQYSIKLNVDKYQIDIDIPSQYFINLYDLPEDVMVEILAYTDYKDIVSICQSSTYNEKMCRKQSFWIKMLLKEMTKDDISYVADILNIPNNRFDKIYQIYDTIMKRDHATMHILPLDDNGYLNLKDDKLLKKIQMKLDQMIEDDVIKTVLFRDADLLVAAYKINGVYYTELYMIHVVNNKIYILGIDEDIKDPGIANEMFTFPLYTPDYWKNDKIKKIYYRGLSAQSIYVDEDFILDPAVYVEAGLLIQNYDGYDSRHPDYHLEELFSILDNYMLVRSYSRIINDINHPYYKHVFMGEEYTDDKEYYVANTSFVPSYEVIDKYNVDKDTYGIYSV